MYVIVVVHSGIRLTMQEFSYRAPRFVTHLPLRYADSAGEIRGICTQISCDGMEAHLSDVIPGGRSGRVSLTYHDGTVELRVTVTHAKRGRCGMRFVNMSEAEAGMMKDLIAGLTNPAKRSCGQAPRTPAIRLGRLDSSLRRMGPLRYCP
jgi:hypothetical protein